MEGGLTELNAYADSSHWSSASSILIALPISAREIDTEVEFEVYRNVSK